MADLLPKIKEARALVRSIHDIHQRLQRDAPILVKDLKSIQSSTKAAMDEASLQQQIGEARRLVAELRDADIPSRREITELIVSIGTTRSTANAVTDATTESTQIASIDKLSKNIREAADKALAAQEAAAPTSELGENLGAVLAKIETVANGLSLDGLLAGIETRSIIRISSALAADTAKIDIDNLEQECISSDLI